MVGTIADGFGLAKIGIDEIQTFAVYMFVQKCFLAQFLFTINIPRAVLFPRTKWHFTLVLLAHSHLDIRHRYLSVARKPAGCA